MKRIFHFYRHCPHCRTGVLLLVTIVLITAINLVAYYDMGMRSQSVGQLRRSVKQSVETSDKAGKRSPHGLFISNGGKGSGTGALSTDAPAFVIADRDTEQGFGYCGVEFCAEGYTQNGLPTMYKKNFDLFGDLLQENGYEYSEVDVPHLPGRNNFDQDAWFNYLIMLFDYLTNSKIKMWHFVTHGNAEGIAIVSFEHPKTDPKIEKFVSDLQERLVPELDRQHQDFLEAIGAKSFSEFIEARKYYMNLLPDFFHRMPSKPYFLYVISCFSDQVFTSDTFTKVGLTYHDCSNSKDSANDEALFFSGLRGDGPLGVSERTMKKVWAAHAVEFSPNLTFTIYEPFDYSFSPAPIDHKFICRIGLTRYLLRVLFDTVMDTISGAIEVVVRDGNLLRPTEIKWEAEDTVAILGSCNGLCRGHLAIEKAYGLGNTVHGKNHLNGNSIPPAEFLKFGYLWNGDDENKQLHDPAVYAIDCTKYENEPEEGGSPSGYCGNRQVDPGEDCDPPGDNCWVEGDEGKKKGAAPSICDQYCHCPL